MQTSRRSESRYINISRAGYNTLPMADWGLRYLARASKPVSSNCSLSAPSTSFVLRHWVPILNYHHGSEKEPLPFLDPRLTLSLRRLCTVLLNVAYSKGNNRIS